MTKPLKLTIGVPCYGGQICSHQAGMWLGLGSAIADPSWADAFSRTLKISMIEGYGVALARNRLLYDALVIHEADWLLMIDADTWVLEPMALLRMIRDASIAKVSAVSAPVRTRASVDSDTRIAAYYQRPNDPTWDQHTTASFINGLQDVDHVGAACLAVNLQDVIRVGARFEFTQDLSEDREFCRQLREAGCRIALDGRVKTGHLSKPFPLYSERG